MPAEIITLYEGPDPCPRCYGWKRIDDGDEGVSWKYWAELTPPTNIAVLAGIVKPIPCPKCHGTGRQTYYRIGILEEGIEDDPVYPDQAMAEQSAQLDQRRWNSFDAPIGIWAGPDQDPTLLTILYQGKLYRLA